MRVFYCQGVREEFVSIGRGWHSVQWVIEHGVLEWGMFLVFFARGVLITSLCSFILIESLYLYIKFAYSKRFEFHHRISFFISCFSNKVDRLTRRHQYKFPELTVQDKLNEGHFLNYVQRFHINQ